jgi:hypothetical protein
MTSVLDTERCPAYDRAMTSDLDSGGESPIELRRRRVFRARIWTGTALYLLAVIALYLWGQGSGPWHLVWAVLPLVFMAWNLTVIVLRVRQMDEYQVKLFFPGLAVGFSVSMFAAITVGTLSSAGYDVPNGGWPIALVGLVAWAVTNLLVRAPNA